MNAPNPYAPPRAAVADVTETQAVQPVRTWTGQGRIGRLRFMAHMAAAYLLMLPVLFVVGLLGAMAGVDSTVVAVATILVTLVYAVFAGFKTVQRSHDMDWSGWMSLLAIIPFVGLIWIFKRGTSGANRFGAPPPANTLGVKILGLVFPVITVIGMVAAIALPAYQAYQTYTLRAKAQQVR